MMRVLIGVVCVSMGGLAVHAQTPKTPEQQANEQALAALPWPVKLGLRSQMVSQVFPLVDRVVLVPDAATYLDELRKWSGKGRWPVLFDDAKLAPMFVRRFKPAQVIRRESVGIALPQDRAARQNLIDQALVGMIGGDPRIHSARQSLAQQQFAPPGIILASPDDPAWTAALALAAGRGQLIAWMNQEPFGQPDDELGQDAMESLMAQVNSLMAETCAGSDTLAPLAYKSLGDDVDAITICRSIACKTRILLPGALRADPGGPHNDGPVAITDLLGRNHDGSRYAIVGWIFGDEARCAYMAMCSIFLPRERAWLWNTYPPDDQWSQYAMHSAASMFEKSGVKTQHMHGASADLRAWLRYLPGGWSADIALINTKGNNDFFDLAEGSAYANDVPVLNEPLALHLIHSWSMQYPASRGTIGERWLDHGAYAAVGSCWEPYLAAFVPPGELVNRWLNFVPFVPAARWWDGQGPLSKPWRVVTIGDPLMLIAPPDKIAKPRMSQPAEYGVDLGERVKSLMREAAEEKSSPKFAEALAILNLLGRDEIAAEVWRLAAAGNAADKAVGRAALDPLFRRRDQDEFLRAWNAAGDAAMNDPLAVDMLWHLFAPRLTPGNSISREALAAMENAIRQPHPQRDVERLAPHLANAFGSGRVLALIQREIKKTTASESKRALMELGERY